MFIQAMLAAVAAAAFCIVFSVDRRSIPLGGLIAGVGYLVFAALHGRGEILAVFVSSAAIALLAEAAARLQKSPVTVFLIPALIPLVPGGDLFESALLVFEVDYAGAAATLIGAMLKAGALAVGTVLVSSAFGLAGRRRAG